MLRLTNCHSTWTTQKDTWLNRLVKATIFGAVSSFFFLFQEQERSSSDVIDLKTGRSRRVSWLAKSSGVTSKERFLFKKKGTSVRCAIFFDFSVRAIPVRTHGAALTLSLEIVSIQSLSDLEIFQCLLLTWRWEDSSQVIVRLNW